MSAFFMPSVRIYNKKGRIGQIAGYFFWVFVNRSNCRLEKHTLKRHRFKNGITLTCSLSVAELCWGATLWGIKLFQATSIGTGVTGPCFLICLEPEQCQEKPDNEPLAVLYGHTAVIVQILLQISERAFDFVVGVRHSLARKPLISK